MKMPITPGEFEKRMKELDMGGDCEGPHIDADKLLCEVLESLGYEGGVKIFKNMDKWYA